MANSKRSDLLEIYKLHAELADRISQRREGVHRLYVSLLGGIVTLLAVSIRFGTETPMSSGIEIAALFVGLLLSIAWIVNIASYRQLNSGKFEILWKLEKKLPFQFYRDEWKLLNPSSRHGYRKLTNVETWLPWIFILLFVVLLVARCACLFD